MIEAERHWSDLRLWRLVVALVLAPLPAAVAMQVLALTEKPLTLDHFLWEVRVTLESSVLWSVIAGLTYLFAVTFWRKRLRRTECLVWGVVAGVLFPYAVLAYRHLASTMFLELLALKPHTDPFPGELPDLTDLAEDLWIALCAAFGLLAGWILWGVGAQPAPMPTTDIDATLG